MKHAVRVYPGSICHGSHREEDIWEAIRGYVPNSYDWKIIADDCYFHLLDADSLTWEEEQEIRQELSEIINNEAWNYMNDIAPEGHYFGAHPGDGSDFGFWPLDDEEEELPAYTELGGYPLFYIQEGNVLCPECANDRTPEEKRQLAQEVNWEFDYLHCDECGERIEAAFEEDEELFPEYEDDDELLEEDVIVVVTEEVKEELPTIEELAKILGL